MLSQAPKRIAALVPLFILCASVTLGTTSRKLDVFGDLNCEEEYARLDYFAINLQNEPDATGVIVFYGGIRFRGRLPKRGEAAVRAGRLKPYLVNRRGLPPNRIVVINGGYDKEFRVELWIIPPGAVLPTTFPTVPVTEVKFRKGRAKPRDFGCQI